MASSVTSRRRSQAIAPVNGAVTPVLSAAVLARVESAKGIFLDVGGGTAKTKGAISMDHRALPGVDIWHHWEELPWPLPDACAHRILLSNIVEYTKPWLIFPVMDEVWRVLTMGGQVLIATVYPGHRFWRDPAHTHAWNELTCHFWNPAHPGTFWEVHRPKPFQVDLNEWREHSTLHVIMTKIPWPEESGNAPSV